MNIVITGASGFIGKNLMLYLRLLGYNCIGLSRQKITEFSYIDDYTNTPCGDVLIHLAEINNQNIANNLSDEYLRTTENITKSLLNKNYQRIIYISSSSLYGDQSIHPHKEHDEVYLNNLYNRVKYQSENLFLTHSNVCIVRLSNVYGRYMSSSTVMAKIFSQINNKSNIPIYLNDIYPVRDFIFIDDLLDILYKLILSDASGIFNVGAGVGVSIDQVARVVLALNEQNERKIISNKTKLTKSIIKLDISKVKKEFNWEPKFTLFSGLNNLSETFKGQYFDKT